MKKILIFLVLTIILPILVEFLFMTLIFLFMAFVNFDISTAYNIIFTNINWQLFRFIYVLLLVYTSGIVYGILKK